jgi:hypothetical protein
MHVVPSIIKFAIFGRAYKAVVGEYVAWLSMLVHGRQQARCFMSSSTFWASLWNWIRLIISFFFQDLVIALHWSFVLTVSD